MKAKKIPTEFAVVGARSVLVETLALSCFETVLGLANDLNRSDGSLFGADGLLAGLFSTTLDTSAFNSGTTLALDVDLIDLVLDEGPTNGLTAFFSSPLMP